MKWMENDFVATENFFRQLKGHFLFFSQANINILAWEFFFVQADGWGVY